MSNRAHIRFFLFGVLFIAAPLRAEFSGYRSKTGFDLKTVKLNLHKSLGVLGGIRYARYLGTSDAYIGLRGSYGSPTGGNPSQEYLFDVSALVGFEGSYSRKAVYEMMVSVGYGEGHMRNRLPEIHEKSYLVVEPSFSSGFLLGGGWRIQANVGYLHMEQAKNFSGLIFGFRLDYKTHTSTKEINE